MEEGAAVYGADEVHAWLERRANGEAAARPASHFSGPSRFASLCGIQWLDTDYIFLYCRFGIPQIHGSLGIEPELRFVAKQAPQP